MKKKTNKSIIAIESWDGSSMSEPRGGMKVASGPTGVSSVGDAG